MQSLMGETPKTALHRLIKISLSPYLPISPSPHLPISLSPYLPISPSPHPLLNYGYSTEHDITYSLFPVPCSLQLTTLHIKYYPSTAA
ncbi:hypothetical protein [Moorena producens]|uniref:hypothetical protein n=1 Tax=Moorena producens TaxID=1155739 RepID=UPI000AC243EC|nr:hypothetical protein [Moorena producens]